MLCSTPNPGGVELFYIYGFDELGDESFTATYATTTPSEVFL